MQTKLVPEQKSDFILNYHIFTKNEKSSEPLSTKATEWFLARVSALVVPSGRSVRELSMQKKQKNTVCYFVILNRENISCNAVLRILDVYPGSRIRICSIPEPNFSTPDPHPGSA
jgi:hypothetical protein